MKLPLPQRGQPFDLSLVYRIIEEINNLWTAIGSRVSSYSSIQIAKNNISSIRTGDMRVAAGFYEIVNNVNVKVDEDKTFTYQFDRPFKYPPIVTVSVESIGNSQTEATKKSTAVLTQVKQDQVIGIVKFETAGKAAVRVNIIAVGIAA
jgi:hypothetical protein